MITKKVLRELPLVPFTETWKPYPHIQVVELMENVFEELRLMPVNVSHTLDKSQHNLFSIWDFLSPDHAFAYQIGMRNSTNKSFSLGLCSGIKVMVCSNLCFNGDFEVFNIHNNTLTIDKIIAMAIDTSQRMLVRSEHTMNWLRGLKDMNFTSSQIKAIIFDMLYDRVLSPIMFRKYIENLIGTKTPTTAYGIQNAFTATVRNLSYSVQQKRTVEANKLIDRECKLYHEEKYKVKL